MTDPTLQLSPEEEQLRKQLFDLEPERFMALIPHIDFHRVEVETQLKEDSKVFVHDEPPSSLYLGQGRHKAHHYARMRLATAVMEKNELWTKYKK